MRDYARIGDPKLSAAHIANRAHHPVLAPHRPRCYRMHLASLRGPLLPVLIGTVIARC